MTIYLDNMAATPIDPRVAARHRVAMADLPGNGNSSEHAFGVESRRAIERSAESLLQTISSTADSLYFTPGASPALWLAVEDAISRVSGRRTRIAATAVEHPALLSALRRAEGEGRVELTMISVDETASPLVGEIEAALAGGIDLLCTMAANNEVGTISDVGTYGRMAARYGARHLVDASQAAGRIDLSGAASADLVVVSGAKSYGPRRTGALIGKLTSFASKLAHDVFGSPDAPSAVAFAFAMELRATERMADEARLATMRDLMESRLLATVPGLRINGLRSSRLAGCLHLSTPHLPGDAAVDRLWGRVAVSTGAACQSGVPGPSHVLTAMSVPEWVRDGAVRIGLGRFTTDEEVDLAIELLGSALLPSASDRVCA